MRLVLRARVGRINRNAERLVRSWKNSDGTVGEQKEKLGAEVSIFMEENFLFAFYIDGVFDLEVGQKVRLIIDPEDK